MIALPGHHHLTADGASLYWEEEGDGPRVLMIHGGTGTSAFDWEFVREPLARHYRLLLTDVRGHGESSDPQERLGIGQIGDDVDSLLERCGGCDAIMAFSVSATAMLGLLCRRPWLARAFVCIGASVTGDASQVDSILNGPWPSSLKRIEHRHAGDADYWRRLQAALAHSWADWGLTPEQLDALDIPTLVVCGDRDRIEPVESALSLSRSLRRGELLVLPDCGHFVSRQRPAELSAAVDGFLARVLSDDPSGPSQLRAEVYG
ncbi:MAG: alpha/beta hydrolase, partial [Solirubrobacteraceae bacterium]